MTREEAIRILDPETTGEALAEIEYYNGFSGKTAAVQAVSDACVLAVAALREQEERRWIPVTKRFPNTGAVVLTFSNKDGVNIGKYVGYGAFVVRKWDINSKPSRTTHWMPLPEPQKEDS